MQREKIRELRSFIRTIELDALRQVEGKLCCSGVSLTQCHLLMEIEEGGKSIVQLSKSLDLDKSTLSRTVEALVKNGSVTRNEQDDRRYIYVELTEKGKELVDSINGTCDEFYGRLMDSIPKNRHRSIINSLGEFSHALKKIKDMTSCCKKKVKK
jgi:DNA-binding MarR family transcriptional regulator